MPLILSGIPSHNWYIVDVSGAASGGAKSYCVKDCAFFRTASSSVMRSCGRASM